MFKIDHDCFGYYILYNINHSILDERYHKYTILRKFNAATIGDPYYLNYYFQNKLDAEQCAKLLK